jgi:hypothetical protein
MAAPTNENKQWERTRIKEKPIGLKKHVPRRNLLGRYLNIL